MRSALLAIVAMHVSALAGTTIHVDRANPNCPGDGSAGNPFCAIQAAIDAAKDGDRVSVAPGIYQENLDLAGKAIGVESTAGAERTVIDGGGRGPVVACHSSETRSTVIAGFTITNGNSGVWCHAASPTLVLNHIRGNRAYDCRSRVGLGGGIRCDHGSPLIVGNVIADNVACGNSGIGGGIFCSESTPVIRNNTISGNVAAGSGSGGGIYFSLVATVGASIIEDNVIAGNVAQGDGDGGGVSCLLYSADSMLALRNNLVSGNSVAGIGPGGGIHAEGWQKKCGLSIVGNTIAANHTAGYGGGLSCGDLTAVIVTNTVRGNRAEYGGGLHLNDSVATLANNTCRDNQATFGGALEAIDGSVTIHTAILAGNYASSLGGAIHAIGCVLSIAGSIVSNNTAGSGGALCCSFCDTEISLTTITRNRASFRGGALSISYAAATRLSNTILWDDTAQVSGDEIDYSQTAPDVSSCDVEGGWPGSGNLDQDPLFRDAASDDFRLHPSSPCVDAGDSALKHCDPDLLGTPRPLDGSLDRQARVDIGALELDHVRLTVTGAATPGGVLTFATDGLPGMSAFLFIAAAPGEVTAAPFGPLYFDVLRPWSMFGWGHVPSTISATIPADVSTPLALVLQEVAIDLTTEAGNTSNVVSLVIE